MMSHEETLMTALHADPRDAVAWLALADVLEETGQTVRAEHLRLLLWLLEHLEHEDRPEKEARIQEIMRAGFVPALPELVLSLDEKMALRLVLIPPGRFYMGRDDLPAARGAENPRHEVVLTEPFYMARTPTTQLEWAAVMKAFPAAYAGGDRPVERVNWSDAQEFIELVGQRWQRRVRLPTEAEWEYACRAGTSTKYYTGETVEGLTRAACFGLDGRETQPVGRREPNAFGLYDMLGNVWEWTLDPYGTYPGDARRRINPRIEGESGQRASRGGSYSNGSECCTCSSRISFAGGGRNTFIGFRIVVECEPGG